VFFGVESGKIGIFLLLGNGGLSPRCGENFGKPFEFRPRAELDVGRGLEGCFEPFARGGVELGKGHFFFLVI
jgi:hypothetical protein